MPCDENNHKDSCEYSVEIAKQFLTLAAGGVAFVVGLAISSSIDIPQTFYWVTGIFIFSIAFGLFFVMSVVAHINKNKNYNVYTPQLKIFAAVQILSFLTGIILLSYVVLWKLKNRQDVSKHEKTSIEITVSDKKITYQVPKGTNIQLHVTPENDIQFQTNISKNQQGSALDMEQK